MTEQNATYNTSELQDILGPATPTFPTQDAAIGIAAMITNTTYSRCQWEIEQNEVDYPGLPGTKRHSIVTAWKAAEAMRLQMETQAAVKERAYE